jgi:non-ribosomal peptide synthetase component F
VPGEPPVLVFGTHHIVSDGWSMGIIVRELAALYAAFTAGLASPLPALPIQHVDYAHWQRKQLRGEAHHNQLRYWKDTLAGAPPALDLPTDRPRASDGSRRAASRKLEIPPALTVALKDLNQREGVTMFMSLLAAFHALLARWTGQDDIVVGTPIANRSHPDAENVVGCFMSALVLRTRLDRGESFRELLGRVKHDVLGALAHQDVPFEELLYELRVRRERNRTPLFNVMFALQNFPWPELHVAELTFSPVAFEHHAVDFDLNVEITDHDGALHCEVIYAAELFDDATIERMLAGYGAVLQRLVADPDASAFDERGEKIGSGDAPADPPIHRQFERQVDDYPEAAAIAFDGGELTYRELDERANQLARSLVARGIGPGARVAVVLERGPELIVALLGVLKAGGVYVPVDPAATRSEIAAIVSKSRSALVITRARMVAAVPRAVPVLALDAEGSTLAAQDATRLPGVATSDGPAFVLYPAGPGAPVVVDHRTTYRLFDGTATWQGPVDAADFWIWELWGALLYGGKLVFPVRWEPSRAHRQGSALPATAKDIDDSP